MVNFGKLFDCFCLFLVRLSLKLIVLNVKYDDDLYGIPFKMNQKQSSKISPLTSISTILSNMMIICTVFDDN